MLTFQTYMKMECDCLYGWIKKTVTYATVSPKMECDCLYGWIKKTVTYATVSPKIECDCLYGWIKKTVTYATVSPKIECDCLYGWIKKTVTYAAVSPKMVNPRDIAGNTEEEEDEPFKLHLQLVHRFGDYTAHGVAKALIEMLRRLSVRLDQHPQMRCIGAL